MYDGMSKCHTSSTSFFNPLILSQRTLFKISYLSYLLEP
nr:MAG TPA: hypothetical protein [Caudoviricetes sp.]